jgi:nitrite reductase/ring-hydroxylating ferredoxin subunit
VKRPARLFFALSATAAASVIVVAVAFALGPSAQPGQSVDEIALVRVERLRPNEVVRLNVKELSGLDRLANAEREKAHMALWGPRSRPDGMPIFLVSARDGVHAFLGVDPRTGCDLEDKTGGGAAVDQDTFVDVCHGTVYDLSGRPTRGPGLWFLDELVLYVRAGVVYAEPHSVVAGGLAVPGY